MRKMEKYIPNLILSVILIFSLLGAEGVAFAKYRVFNEQVCIDAVESNDVTGKVLDSIEKYFENSSNYSRIPSDVYMSAVDENLVKKAVEAKITGIFSYIKGETDEISESEIDFTELEKSIDDYFNEFAEKNNVEINDDFKSQLSKTIETAESEIDDFTDVFMLSYIKKTGALSKVRKIYGMLDVAMIVTAVAAIVCVILIFVMNLKKKSYFLYWLSASVICSSAIAFIPGLYIRFSGYVKGLVIRNDYIYSAVTGFINKLNDELIILESAALVLGIIIMVLFAFASRERYAEN